MVVGYPDADAPTKQKEAKTLSDGILVLTEELTNKIAAGEVIERPASIIKELFENSLDAGATDVSINLDAEGGDNICITDNGVGIAAAEVALAFNRYATSKIKRFDDLYSLDSYGFRGEALPSIASVAKVEMRTRQEGAIGGAKIVVQYGRIVETGEIGCPVGTQIRVSDIFGNVPVRKKFLKTAKTERQLCLETIGRLALPHNALRVKVESAGRVLLSVPATRDLGERLALMTDPEFAGALIPVSATGEGASLRGFVTPPDRNRSASRHIQIYVNNRFVRDNLLQHAVMTAYRHLLEPRRYPVACLFLDVCPAEVDVNVHPAKMEVRFQRPQEIYHLVATSLGMALAGTSPPPDQGMPIRLGQKGTDDYATRVQEAVKRYTLSAGRGNPRFSPASPTARETSTISGEAPQLPLFLPQNTASSAKGIRFSDLKYLGRQGGSYLVFSAPAGLIIIDQHAAHERVNYERLKHRSPAPADRASQRLLLSEMVALSSADYALFMASREIMAEAGLEVEPFGADRVVIRAIPALLKDEEPARLLRDILDDLSAIPRQEALEERREKILIALSCRRSIMANEMISEAEVSALCQALDAAPNRFTCPHGRPVAVFLNSAEIDRMFRRK